MAEEESEYQEILDRIETLENNTLYSLWIVLGLITIMFLFQINLFQSLGDSIFIIWENLPR